MQRFINPHVKMAVGVTKSGILTARDIDSSEYGAGNQHAGHRGPYAAGGADRYYGRRCLPNFTYHGVSYYESEMTDEQVAEYMRGWDDEADRKDWN